MTRSQRRRCGARLAPGLLSLLLLATLVGIALGSPRVAAAPTLTILAPANDAIIGNESAVVVIFVVSEFNLTKPGTGGSPDPNEGHVDVFVDGSLTLAASESAIELPLASGIHTIRLQLVADNGTALSPDVSASVRVTVTQGPASGASGMTITSPAEGSVRGTDVAISFRLANFALVPPGGPSDVPNEGHIHVFVDARFYEELTEYQPVQLGLSAGPHTVTLQLVDDAHQPWVPDVSATVHFTVEPGVGRATDYSMALAVADGLLGLGILGVLLFRGRIVKR